MVTFLIVCVIAAILLGGLAWYRQKKQSVRVPAAKISHKNRAYKAVEVCPGPVCCKAAIAAAGNRVLLESSPRLPLDKCDRIADCKCTYINHTDRRNGDDRRNPFGSLSQAGVIGMRDANKREGMDRRQSVDVDLEKVEYD